MDGIVYRADKGALLTADEVDENFRLVSEGVDARLPIYQANAIPTSDKGPIYVVGIGHMEWAGSRYVALLYAHGQCQFRYVSASECRLYPYGGNGLIINRRQYRIPTGGVPLAPTGLAAGNNYYVYAKDDGIGGIALEALQLAANPHSTHIDGVEIRTGDSTKTLVGWVFCQTAATFTNTLSCRGVASWFNRRPAVCAGQNAGGATTSTTPIGLIQPLLSCKWADEAVVAALGGYFSNTSVSSGVGYIAYNGNPIATSAQVMTLANGNGLMNTPWMLSNGQDTLVQISAQGYTTAGTMTVNISLFTTVNQ